MITTENDKKKRFEDWEDVDCNQCERYWDNSCDGVPLKGSRRACKTFSATRNVIIPLQIKRLEKDVKALWWAWGVLAVLTILLPVLVAIGR